MCKNLELRAGVYHFRLNIPTDLKPIIGKTAISETLRTGDKREANRRAAPLRKYWKAYFADLRASKAKGLTQDTLDKHLRAFLDRLQAEDTKERNRPTLPMPPDLALLAQRSDVGSRNEMDHRETIVNDLRSSLVNPYHPGADLDEQAEESFLNVRTPSGRRYIIQPLANTEGQSAQEKLNAVVAFVQRSGIAPNALIKDITTNEDLLEAATGAIQPRIEEVSIPAIEKPSDNFVPYAMVQDEIMSFMRDSRLNFPTDSIEFQQIAKGVTQKVIESHQIAIARAKGDAVAEKQLLETLLPPEPEPQTSPLLSVIFDLWKAEHLSTGGPHKTTSEFWSQVERFIDMHSDLPVHLITPVMVREFKDALLRYPKHMKKAEKELPFADRLALIDKTPERPVLSPRSVNDKSLGAIGAVLGYAKTNHYIESNPAAGIKVKVTKNKAPSRLPYTTEDLQTIFNFPIYTKSDRPKAGAGEAAYWLPLIGIFTGARLEEIGQLLVEDVKQKQGIWYFAMLTLDDSQEDAKHFKNAQSRRMVPIHSTLIKIGLLDYVKEQRAAGESKLFPLVKSAGKDIAQTGPWSKWWGRYARKHGGFGPKKVFHSFRHAAKDAFREAEVPSEIYDVLQGHTPISEGGKYGSGGSLKLLAKNMEKLSYDVNLGHLMKTD